MEHGETGLQNDHFATAIQWTDGFAAPLVTLVTRTENPVEVIEWA